MRLGAGDLDDPGRVFGSRRPKQHEHLLGVVFAAGRDAPAPAREVHPVGGGHLPDVRRDCRTAAAGCPRDHAGDPVGPASESGDGGRRSPPDHARESRVDGAAGQAESFDRPAHRPIVDGHGGADLAAPGCHGQADRRQPAIGEPRTQLELARHEHHPTRLETGDEATDEAGVAPDARLGHDHQIGGSGRGQAVHIRGPGHAVEAGTRDLACQPLPRGRGRLDDVDRSTRADQSGESRGGR